MTNLLQSQLDVFGKNSRTLILILSNTFQKLSRLCKELVPSCVRLLSVPLLIGLELVFLELFRRYFGGAAFLIGSITCPVLNLLCFVRAWKVRLMIFTIAIKCGTIFSEHKFWCPKGKMPTQPTSTAQARIPVLSCSRNVIVNSLRLKWRRLATTPTKLSNIRPTFSIRNWRRCRRRRRCRRWVPRTAPTARAEDPPSRRTTPCLVTSGEGNRQVAVWVPVGVKFH